MTLIQFNRIVEIRTKIISMSSFLCGSAYASVIEETWSWSRFVIMGLAVLFVDMGTTGFNSYFDFLNGTDTREYNFERDKVLVHEGVAPGTALIISLGLFSIAGILGILLAWMTSWMILAVGAVSMAVGFAYTGGPCPISRTPFGELFAGGFLGSLLFCLSYFIQAGSISTLTAAASLPFLLFIAMILTVNNTCDMKADVIAGRKTLSIISGARLSRFILAAEGAAAYALSFLFVPAGIYPFYVLPFLVLSLSFSVREFLIMLKRGFSLETKGLSMGSISKIFLIFSTSLLLGFLLTLLT